MMPWPYARLDFGYLQRGTNILSSNCHLDAVKCAPTVVEAYVWVRVIAIAACSCILGLGSFYFSFCVVNGASVLVSLFGPYTWPSLPCGLCGCRWPAGAWALKTSS